MPTCSEASERTLRALLGEGGGTLSRNAGGMRLGPVAVKVDDPVEEVEALLDDFESGTRRASRFLRNQRGSTTPLAARPCCVATVQELERRLSLLGEVSEHLCAGCGAKWAIVYRLRPEGRNAR